MYCMYYSHSVDNDVHAIHNEFAVLCFDCSIESTVGGVILEQVGLQMQEETLKLYTDKERV